MSCSINKLKFHMLFTCQNFMFSDFTRKNNFYSRKWWEVGGGWCPPTPIPFSTALRLQAAMEELHNLKLQENLHGEFLFRGNTASKSSLTLILPRRFPKKFLKSSEQCLFAFLNGHLLWRECLSGNLLTKTKAAVWWLCS